MVDDEEVRRQMQGLLGSVEAPTPPPVTGVIRRGLALRLRRWVAVGLSVVLVVAATLIPLRLLGALGGKPASRPGTQSGHPLVARFSCDSSGIHMPDPVVQAQADGVHVEVTAERNTGFFIEQTGLPPFIPYSGRQTEGGTIEGVYPLPPGENRVACNGQDSEEPMFQTLTVSDPNGYWAPTNVECPRGDYAARPLDDRVGTPRGLKGDPRDLLLDGLRGLRESDRVTRAAYPTASHPAYVVERDGRIIGFFQFADQGETFAHSTNGRWIVDVLPGSWAYCTSDISFQPSPDLV